MKENTCDYEKHLIKERGLDEQNPEIAAHVTQCADCRETLRVANWMQTFAASAQPKTLLKPGFIRWKAQLIEKQRAARRATQSIVWAQTAAVALVSIMLGWLLFKNQAQFSSTVTTLFSSFELIAAPMLVLFAVAILSYLISTRKRRESSKQNNRG